MYCKKELKIKHIFIIFTLILVPALAPAATGKTKSHRPLNITCQPIPSFSIPSILFLCGQPLPLHDRHCREMLDRELTIAVYNHAQVVLWIKRSPRYFPLFSRKIKSLGLPIDLKYIAVSESALLENIHSRAGAAGLWQFMRRTGRHLGLRINTDIDERLDPARATECALNYLKYLRDKFNSWPLALAAYNCGEKRVADAVKEQKTDDYHTLSLPTESERYLYRLAAIKLILSNPGKYGYKIDQHNCYKPLPVDYINLKLKHKFSLIDFALHLGTTYYELKKLNPHLINKRLPKGEFNLVLPQGYKDKVAGILSSLTPLSSRRTRYLVRKGDTLSAISHRFNISVAHLKKINRLNNAKIMVGQKLLLQ